MTEAPKETNDGIHISTGEHKKKAFGLFGGSESGKLILIPDKAQRQVGYLILLLPLPFTFTSTLNLSCF